MRTAVATRILMQEQEGASFVTPRLALALLAVVLSGCATRAPPDAWRLGGAFTADRTQADIDAVCQAGAGTSTCQLMESYPEQFAFRFENEAKCSDARARIVAVPHTTVGNCTRTA